MSWEIETKQPEKPRYKDSWDESDLVYYTSGTAFGLLPDGRTIFLGTELEVQEILKTGCIYTEHLTSLQCWAIQRILNLREELKENVISIYRYFFSD